MNQLFVKHSGSNNQKQQCFIILLFTSISLRFIEMYFSDYIESYQIQNQRNSICKPCHPNQQNRDKNSKILKQFLVKTYLEMFTQFLICLLTTQNQELFFRFKQQLKCWIYFQRGNLRWQRSYCKNETKISQFENQFLMALKLREKLDKKIQNNQRITQNLGNINKFKIQNNGKRNYYKMNQVINRNVDEVINKLEKTQIYILL
ncbi:unnamed protein product (macronuclear) [Paramecium tetraurelia]|uniref:Transmembrane protein n=1 Tax=Paramecium tetraurelia TaxID=5888 RepID=A0BXZ3_PARTE|nr:uncharacterized protein GSPATT00033263001 [Paramecium tetraurelia]CAK63410.1 unnamed protein product [Paramecium tetraurelia]|eukprot:XP_001430808.1 hypothetical protein (macronuclear) [Paramecium tetraurelia strain d4-2]